MARLGASLAALGVACRLMLIASLMVWFQNYVVLLPAVVWLLVRGGSAPLALAAIFVGLQLSNPTLLGRELFEAVARWAPPLWVTLFATAAILRLARDERAATGPFAPENPPTST